VILVRTELELGICIADMWRGMNPGGGLSESCREEDPLTCHMDCWWVYTGFFVSSCGSPQSE